MRSLRFAILLLATTHALDGCVVYCPAYATRGCLTTEELHHLGAQETTRPKLIAYLKDRRSWVREEAARTLGELRAGEAAPALLEMVASNEERDFVRAAAARALGRIHPEQAPDVLAGTAAQASSPPELKIAAIEALCAYQSMEAIAPLTQDQDLLVSAAAERAVRTRCASPH